MVVLARESTPADHVVRDGGDSDTTFVPRGADVAPIAAVTQAPAMLTLMVGEVLVARTTDRP